MIQQENKKPAPSNDRISSFQQILEYINDADTPDKEDLVNVEKLFCSYHEKYKNKTKYPVVKADRIEFAQIIMQIKLEMEANPERYSSFTVTQFFEKFLVEMDEFWIRNMFTPSGLNRKFREILGAIKTKAVSGKAGSYKKLTYQSVTNR